MKRLICMLLCCVMLIGMGIYPVSAADEEVWLREWKLSAIPQGNSGAEFVDDSLSLWFKTAGEEGRAAAVHAVPNPEDCLCLNFDVRLQGLDYTNNRKLYLKNPDSLNVAEVLNFKGDTLQVFGQEVQTGLEENRDYGVTFAFRTDDCRASVWLDENLVFDQTVESLNNKLDFDALQLEFCNYTFPRESVMESAFLVKKPAILRLGHGLEGSMPEDGAAFVSPEEIVLDFGGMVARKMLYPAHWTLLENDEPVEIVVTYAKGKLYIRPEEGFKAETAYRLTADGQWDVFGETLGPEIHIAFTTAPEGYRKPVAMINASAVESYQGVPIRFTCKTEGTAVVERVTYWVDGAETGESTSAPDFAWEFDGAPGSYKISAVAWDAYQNSSEPSEITVEILENHIPRAEFSGLKDGDLCAPERLANTEILATDGDGDETIARVEVWVDGELLETLTAPPYTVNLSGLKKGGHTFSVVAVDTVGASGRTEVSVVVTGESKQVVLYENDLESYGGGNAPTNIGVATGDARFTASKDYGAEHGIVAELSSLAMEEGGASPDGSWFGFPTSGAGMRFTAEMDLNVREMPQALFFMLKQSGEMEIAEDVGIADGQFYAKNGKETAHLPFVENQWYHLTYQVDLGAHCYSFWVNGQSLAENFTISNPNQTKVDLRFLMRIPAGTAPGRIAVDNFRVSKTVEEPVISEIKGIKPSADGRISPEDETVRVLLTAPVMAESVSVDTVKVYREDETVVLESVVYDGEIKLNFAEALRGQSVYRVEISTEVQDENGTPLDDLLTAQFETGFASLDIKDIDLRKKANRVYLEGTAVNLGAEPKTCFIVLTVWDKGCMTDLSVTPAEWLDGEAFQTKPVSLGTGQSLEYAVWDSLCIPKVIAMGTIEG